MSAFDSLASAIAPLSGPGWRLLLLALTHSVWQGAIAALLLRFVLSRLSAAATNARYLVAIVALASVVVAAITTWSIMDVSQERSSSRESAKPQGSVAELQAVRTSGLTRAVLTDTSHSPRKLGLSTSSAFSRNRHWSAFVAAVWLAGLVAMLARMAWLIAGARRLADGLRMTDASLLAKVDKLRARLGIRRAIAVVDSGRLGPAVLGVLRPVLLLPAALVSGLPAECLEAIMAHELAHIRRHDYLVNLAQMLVESAFYFNPAVWWISRQIRREREACCDLLAVAATGSAIGYAATLADWLERVGPQRVGEMAAAPAYGSGSALDRVRRLLVADYRPELRASWRVFTSGVMASAVLVAVLWRGTHAGVALAAEILSPAERMAQLSEERDRLRPVIPEGDNDALLAGTITTADGRPVPKRIDGTVSCRNDHQSYSGSVDVTAPEFSIKSHSGRVWLSVFAEGYAPALVGPLEVRPGERVEGLAIVIEPGFSTRLKIVNADGAPVPGVRASGLLADVGSGNSPQWKGDAAGEVLLDHMSKHAYDVTLAAPGYQSKAFPTVRFEPDDTTTITLDRAVPSRGTVVAPDGTPIAGATLRCALRVGPGRPALKTGQHGDILATTDAEGHFTLDSLDDGAQYTLYVESAANGRRLFPGITSGRDDLEFVVGPDITVRGRAVGDLTRLNRDRKKQPIVRYHQSPSVQPTPDMSYGLLFSGEALVDQGTGQFEIKNLLPNTLWINAGPRTVSVEPDEIRTEVFIDIDEQEPKAQRRTVQLRFVSPDVGLFPRGQLRVMIIDEKGIGQAQQMFVPIKAGVAEVSAYETGFVSYSAANVVGYWFPDNMVRVTPGAEPLVEEVSVMPAGAVEGRVTNSDGTPAGGDVQVSTRGTISPTLQQSHTFAVENVRVDAAGKFFLSPLPIGSDDDYVVRASRGFENALSQPVHVDAEHVSPRVAVQFSPVAKAAGQVVASDGTPRADIAVALEFRHTAAAVRYGPAPLSDSQGRFHFEGLSTGVGEYWVHVDRTGKQPVAERLNLDGAPVRIVVPD